MMMVITLSMSDGMWASPFKRLHAKFMSNKNTSFSCSKEIVIDALIDRSNRWSGDNLNFFVHCFHLHDVNDYAPLHVLNKGNGTQRWVIKSPVNPPPHGFPFLLLFCSEYTPLLCIVFSIYGSDQTITQVDLASPPDWPFKVLSWCEQASAPSRHWSLERRRGALMPNFSASWMALLH